MKQNIYIRVVWFLFFFNIICIWVGFRKGMTKTRTQPKPVSGFFFLTHTRPYNLSGWVKSNLLGSGRTGYLRIGLKLPSLNSLPLFIACLLLGGVSKGKKIPSTASEGRLIGEEKLFEASTIEELLDLHMRHFQDRRDLVWPKKIWGV